jgi:flagellar protein FliJ
VGVFPLQVLLDHSRHRMEAAERLLRMTKRKEEQANLRLLELRGYKSEYQSRLAGTGGGMDIVLLRDFYAFMVKLDSAIAHQDGEVEKAHANWISAHQAWMELRQKVKAYEVLARRHDTQERLAQDKREQRQTDEAALHKHAAVRREESR